MFAAISRAYDSRQEWYENLAAKGEKKEGKQYRMQKLLHQREQPIPYTQLVLRMLEMENVVLTVLTLGQMDIVMNMFIQMDKRDHQKTHPHYPKASLNNSLVRS